MKTPHSLVFIKCDDQPALGRAVLQVNASRRQRLFYTSLILTAPRRGWIAMLLGGSGAVDHLLMRNLSGQLDTLAFELKLGILDFVYRLHRNGRTIGAFESNPLLYVNHRMQMIQSSQDLDILDLAEPLDRFVLKRYHELQHPRTPVTTVDIPADVETYYRGDVVDLRLVLRADADESFIASVLAPGFSPEAAFGHLVAVLDLPYVNQDYVILRPEEGEPRHINGFEITDPATWQDDLPRGWRRMPAVSS